MRTHGRTPAVFPDRRSTPVTLRVRQQCVLPTRRSRTPSELSSLNSAVHLDRYCFARSTARRLRMLSPLIQMASSLNVERRRRQVSRCVRSALPAGQNRSATAMPPAAAVGEVKPARSFDSSVSVEVRDVGRSELATEQSYRSPAIGGRWESAYTCWVCCACFVMLPRVRLQACTDWSVDVDLMLM